MLILHLIFVLGKLYFQWIKRIEQREGERERDSTGQIKFTLEIDPNL